MKGPSAWQFHDSEVEAFTQQDGLTSDYVHCVLQDREGNVWFGTSGGLDRFRQSPVVSVPLQPISHSGALPIPSLHSFITSALAVADQGALWAAGIGPQVLLKIQNDQIVTQLRDQPVDSAYRDPNGVIWLATPRSVFRLAREPLDTIGSKQGAVTYNYDSAVPAGQGLVLRQLDLPTAGGIAVSPQSRVKAITQDRLGRLWISMESGTFRLESSSWTSLESLGGPQGTATAEFTDSDGRIWFGFANAVAVLDRDRVRIFSRKDGVQVGSVTSIEGDGKNIWIGGEFGLEFFDGSRFQSVNPADGSVFGGVSGIVTGPGDGLWFSENRGIIHIREAQLRRLGSGKVEFESFGLQDGLTAELSGALASPSAVETTDGRIWFATTMGLAWINPRRIVRNTVPPPVLIESVIANGRKYDNSTALTLPSRTANLQIAYTATSLTVPERVRFRYKLEGQDKEWQDAGTRRTAFYTNLDPGSYKFRVIACNNDGVWNNAGASLDFSIAPTYYQTSWFRAACLALFMVLIWMLYRLRVHSVEQRYLERNRAAEALAARAAISLENTRLYRDIEERDRRIRRLVDSNIIGIVIWDLDGRLIDANDAFLHMVRYEREDLQAGLRWFDMTPPEWQEAHARYEAEELKATGMMQAREKEYFRKDGSRVPVLIGAACFEDQPNQGVAYILDLSELKRAEEARRRSEAYLAEAQRLTHTGSCAIDGTSRETVYWSDEMFQLFGFDPQQGPPRWEQFLEQIHPEDREKLKLANERTFLNKVNCDVEFRIVKSDGTVKHIHGIGHPVLSPAGELVQVLGTMVDITDRKQADEERERLREAHRVVVETATDAVVSADESGAIQFANPATTKVFGYDPGELIGKPLTVLMPEFMRKLHELGFRRYLATGQRHINWQGTELIGLRKNGQEFPVEVAFGELTMNGHRVFTGFIRDITERKQAEEERERLRQVQADLAHVTRVSTVGELTASLAHEIKQPIGAAVTNAEACFRLLDRDQPDLPEAREAALEMTRDARRAADIIERVKSLYQKGSSQLETVDLNQLIEEMATMMGAEANRHSVRMSMDLANGLPEVTADRVQLQQALMNLMLNGIEAMRDTPGELSIKSQLGGDGQVLISVSDTGVGLPTGNTDQLFNAFFTTKSQGTGMGLAITRSIVESHGGRIWATANSGSGATFQFTLPMSEAAGR
jgi:PAS domain S-box-containing protein